MEGGAVAVEAVALVPLLVLLQGVVDGLGFPGQAEFAEHGLDGGGEEEPVVEAGFDLAGFDEAAGEIVFGGGVELGPELFGGADDGECKEGGVDKRLLVAAEVESVRRLGIAAVLDGEAGPLAVADAEGFFCRVDLCAGPGSASSQGARPQSRRPTASRCVDWARAASSPFLHSMGMVARSSPPANGVEDGLESCSRMRAIILWLSPPVFDGAVAAVAWGAEAARSGAEARSALFRKVRREGCEDIGCGLSMVFGPESF